MEVEILNKPEFYRLLKEDFEAIVGETPAHITAYKNKETGEEIYIHNGKLNASENMIEYFKEEDVI